MKAWKKGLGAVALLALTIGLTACGSSEKAKKTSSGKTELTVTTWNYDTTPEFKALFEAFEKKNPDIDVKNIDIASDDYDTKLTTMLSSGDTTDVLTMKNLLSYSNYALRDQLVDLTSHISKLNITPAKDSYKMYDVKGKTYAQPYRTDFWVLYYNKKLFDQAGVSYPDNWTWEDYVKNAEKLSKKDGENYGTYQHIWRSTVQAIAAAQNNANLLKPNYSYMEDYYKNAVTLQKEKAQMDFGTAKSTKVTYQSQFEEQKTAMMLMGSWYMGALLTNIDSGKTDVSDWGIAPVPQKAGESKVTSFGSPTAFAINKASKNKKAAQKFLDFCSSEEGAKILVKVGVVPSYKTEAINKAYFARKGMPTDTISKKAFTPDKVAIEFPISKNGPAIDKILQEEHELIMTGDKTPKEGIQSMEKRVKNEIE